MAQSSWCLFYGRFPFDRRKAHSCTLNKKTKCMDKNVLDAEWFMGWINTIGY